MLSGPDRATAPGRHPSLDGTTVASEPERLEEAASARALARRLSTVLIAEDEPSVRWLIRMTLDTRGFEILEVEDGYAALDAVRRTRPALIFLDWAMPGLTGLEVCRAVRADPAARDIKIVMLTARTQEKDRMDAMEAGADDYITKPFSPVQLLDKVNDVARSRGGPGA